MVTIESIEVAGPAGRARRLVLSDGNGSRSTSASVVKELALTAEMRISLESLESQLSEAEQSHARDRALRMLSHRDRSRSELIKALEADGYPQPIAVAVVDRLVEVELVEDVRFAASWVRSRTSAGVGARKIARELAQKGVSDEIAKEAMAAESPAEDQLDLARRVLRGSVPTSRAEREKMVRRLLSRGFDMRTALEAVDSNADDEGGATHD